MHSKKTVMHGQKGRLWSSKCVCMVCVRQESSVASPLRCSWMWPLSPSVLNGRITIFLSSKENNFEITISCFDKFCVGNSTLTFIAALCGPALPDKQSGVRYVYCNAASLDVWTYRFSRNKTSEGKVFSGNLQWDTFYFISTTFFSYFLS